SSRPSKLLNSKELSPTCHPITRLVPITIPRQSSRRVRATRTGWLMYAVNAVIAQYVETVNDHRRWECYVSTAYEHTNKHYLVSNVPQNFGIVTATRPRSQPVALSGSPYWSMCCSGLAS